MASDIYVRVTDNEGSEDSPMQNDDEQTKEVVKFLKELRSNLDENRKDLLDNEVKQVTKECKERGEQSLRTISEFMRNFVNVEAVKLGLNLETMKQIIRVFLLCWNKQGLAERIMKEIYDEDENEEPEVDEQMPAEVKGMDNDAINVYAKALSQGWKNLTEGDPVFDELRAEVKMLAEKQHYWNEKSPTSFVQLEKSLDTMRAEGKELGKMLVSGQGAAAANEETRDLGDEAMESPEMDTQTDSYVNFSS
ncbi:hypothetical protein MAR_028892 [Mya arenaria]|uniref:Uncharacterized protein n=1 Tax=Mya arenaria TaxID=6604 RepID=A0ABY7DEX2_MYAAR|nr:hypothetical protein MAR_028892 [Mya arenaria]